MKNTKNIESLQQKREVMKQKMIDSKFSDESIAEYNKVVIAISDIQARNRPRKRTYLNEYSLPKGVIFQD